MDDKKNIDEYDIVPENGKSETKYELPDNLYSDSDALDELALDMDELTELYETQKEREEYEGFIEEYKEIMAERLGDTSLSDDEETKEENDEPLNAETDVTDDVDSTDEPVEAETENEHPKTESRSFEDFEVMVELPYDIEFHSDIVEKSERKNAEDYIRLVPEKAEVPEEEPVYEDVFKPEEEPEPERPAPISDYSVYEDYDPEQIAMNFDSTESEHPRDNSVYDEKHPRIIDHIFDIVEILAITLTAAIFITTILFRFSLVDGHSMDQTLADKDTLLISNVFYTPSYEDIIVFEYVDEVDGTRRPLVKRVIGLEGDIIRVTADYEVYRNGKLLDEEYAYMGPNNHNLPIGTWKVGEGEVFVMGDHRNDSHDSRSIGPIKVDSILGRVLLRLYPNFGIIE